MNYKPPAYPKCVMKWRAPDDRFEQVYRERLKLMERRRIHAIRAMLRKLPREHRLCLAAFLDQIREEA